MTRFYAVLVMIVMLAACSPRGELTMMPDAAGVGVLRSVYVATTRGFDAENLLAHRNWVEPLACKG